LLPTFVIRVGMCEDNRQSTRVGVICCHLWIKIYDKVSASAGITICLLLVPLIVCHHNVMDTLLRHTLLWYGVWVREPWLGISDDRHLSCHLWSTTTDVQGSP
jgi:hypothetical protein